jgi:tRNA pseudouridine38-40 synthase
LLYLNPKGTIHPAAVIKKGERRENPFKEKRRFDATSFSANDESAKSVDEGDDEDTHITKEDLAETEG